MKPDHALTILAVTYTTILACLVWAITKTKRTP